MDETPVLSTFLRRAALPIAGTPLQNVFASVYVAREVCPPGDEYVHAALSDLALFLTEAGEAESVVNGRVFRHQPGSLILLNRGVPLCERIGPRQPWKVGYMMLSGAWADALSAFLAVQEVDGLAYAPAPLLWQQQFTNLLNLGFGQDDGWHWPFLSEFAALLGQVTRAPARENTDSILEEVERLLDAAPGCTLSLEELARTFGLSIRQFGYRFQKAAGCAPAVWLRQRRIIAARRLLSEGKSVTETAEILGFANPYHFSRLFKTLTGVPPSALYGLRGQQRLIQSFPSRAES